jgi:hypothetical protein
MGLSAYLWGLLQKWEEKRDARKTAKFAVFQAFQGGGG